MVQNIDLCGYGIPTPVQAYTIPAVLQSRDIIAIAQTGKFIALNLIQSLTHAKVLARPQLTSSPRSPN